MEFFDFFDIITVIFFLVLIFGTVFTYAGRTYKKKEMYYIGIALLSVAALIILLFVVFIFAMASAFAD